MIFRIIQVDKKNKLLGIINTAEISEMVKTLHFCKENHIPLEINTEDMADTDGEEHYIIDVEPVATLIGAEILPYIAVYVE